MTALALVLACALLAACRATAAPELEQLSLRVAGFVKASGIT